MESRIRIPNEMKHIKTDMYEGVSYSIYYDEDWYFGFVTDELEYPIVVRFASSIKECERWLRNRIVRYDDERKARDEYKEKVNQGLLFRTM